MTTLKRVTLETSRRPWTPGALKQLHRGAANKTTVRALALMLKRTEGAVRQKARVQGLALGPKSRGVSTSRARYGNAKRLGLPTHNTHTTA